MQKGIETPQDIWVFPSRGSTPNISPVLNVRSIEEAFDASAALQDQHRDATETYAAMQAEELRAMQKDLAAKGVHFDAERLLRRSFGDRLMGKWYALLDWLRPIVPLSNSDNSAEEYSNEVDSFFEIVLGMTYQTDALPFDYDVIFGETRRLKTAVTETITAANGVAPRNLDIQFNEPEDDDRDHDWDHEEAFRTEMAEFDMIWPSVGNRPAFALAERQLDGGLPIEIVLLVCSVATYDRIIALA